MAETSVANIENCFIKLNVNFTTASGWLQRLVRSSVSPIVICCIWHAIWASSKKVVSLWVFDAGGAVNILMIPRIYQCSLVDEQPQPLLRGRVRPIPVSVRTKTTFEAPQCHWKVARGGSLRSRCQSGKLESKSRKLPQTRLFRSSTLGRGSRA